MLQASKRRCLAPPAFEGHTRLFSNPWVVAERQQEEQDRVGTAKLGGEKRELEQQYEMPDREGSEKLGGGKG